jgi:hypothetical protein
MMVVAGVYVLLVKQHIQYHLRTEIVGLCAIGYMAQLLDIVWIKQNPPEFQIPYYHEADLKKVSLINK